MKKRILLILAVVLVFGVSGCTNENDVTATPIPDTTPPSVPATLSPAPNTTYNHFPRTTTLVWGAVTDFSPPVTYRIEIQSCQGSVESPTDCGDGVWPGCDGVQTSTTCTFDFSGMQPGRWRVQAVDALGNTSAFGNWSTFAFSI